MPPPAAAKTWQNILVFPKIINASVSSLMSFNEQVVRSVERIVEAKTSGALICQCGDTKRILFFEQGALVGCRSNIVDERLGETMVAEGRITEEQLRRAAEHIRSGRKMGQIMVELGYLKGGEIEGYVRLQILAVASRVLLDPCERLVFSTQVPVDAVTLSPVLMAEVFLSAARRIEDVDADHDALLTDELALVRASSPPVAAEKLDLSRDELAVLNSVETFTTAVEILRSSPLPRAQVARALIGLVHAGLLARAQVATPDILLGGEDASEAKDFEKQLAVTYRQVQGQNHWAVLGLDQGADYSHIERAYNGLRDQFSPAKFAHLPDAELKKKISFIEARLKDAFLTLSAQSQAIAYGKLVQREPEYESQREDWELPASQYEPLAKDSAKARTIFRKALEAFREKDYWAAIQLTRAAIELNEENDAEHHHLLGAALANNPRWRKDAEKHLKIATQLSWEPRYLVTLARFYHREGNHQGAYQLLEQVKAIAPDHPIPELEERRSRPKAAGRRAK